MKKLFVFIFVLCLVFCMAFSVSAAEFKAGTYKWNESFTNLTGNLGGSNSRDGDFEFYSPDGQLKTGVRIRFEQADGAVTALWYFTDDTSYEVAWTSSDGWTAEEYRYIQLSEPWTSDSQIAEWMALNSVRITGSLEDIFGGSGDLVTVAISWADQFVDFIVGHSLVLLYAVVPLVGLGIGLFVRSKKVN